MTSEVTICNLALSHLRAGSINSLDETSLPAQQCKLWYPELRDMLLENAPWQFARKIKPLALLTGVDLFNWAFAYQYPADSLYINRILRNFETVDGVNISSVSTRFFDPNLPIPDLTPQVEYELQLDDSGGSNNQVIATNEPDARIDYRFKITDPNFFSKQFVIAFSHLLAAELVTPIRGESEATAKAKSDQFTLYTSFIAGASATNLNQQFHPTPESDYITVRR